MRDERERRDAQAPVPSVSPFPPVLPVQPVYVAGQSMAGEEDRYGDIQPGVENL